MLFSKKNPEKEAQKEYAHYMATISSSLSYNLGTSFLDEIISDKRKLSDSLYRIFGTYYLEDVFTEFVSDDVWEKFVERVNTQKHNYAKRQNKIFIKKEMREKTR
ncbi:hypothetical protein [Pectinatus frisingensis]|uniref:hypothetical protein n=1 Tax=Pectinatus frisingensis TaxID=865 RepID=UPI0018C805D0|nr:hypothetical protein [Pectinatus frisingensis]